MIWLYPNLFDGPPTCLAKATSSWMCWAIKANCSRKLTSARFQNATDPSKTSGYGGVPKWGYPKMVGFC